MKRFEIISLRTAMMVPVIYFAIIVLGGLFYPGYSHSRQAISELGASGAPRPEIFNVGVIVNGIAILIGAFGFFRALQHLGASQIAVWCFCSVLVLFGIAVVMVGLFPMPDPKHAGKELPLVITSGPLFLAFALWKRPEAKLLNAYLIGTSTLMVVTFLMLMGVGGLVTYANVGCLHRVSAFAAFPWIGIAAYATGKMVLLHHDKAV